MYNSSGQGNGHGNSSSNIPICVEPLSEWKVQEIGYDGYEKYIKPQDFKDVLRKNSRRINWRKIVGNEASIDWEAREDGPDEPMPMADDPKPEAAEAGQSAAIHQQEASTSDNLFEPVAGPWASVGKHLVHALKEVHILIDALNISGQTLYLNPVINAPVQDDRTEIEQINHSKAYQLCTRKKTIAEAARVIDRMMKYRQQFAGDVSVGGDEGNFTKELRELRENWRVRKMGTNIHGDLGYKTYAPKFAPNEVFDIVQKTLNSRREATLRFDNTSYVGIRLAHNLRYRTKLFVFVEPDTEIIAEKIYKSSNQVNKQQATLLDEDDVIKHIHWTKALPWAQDTLICKDILAQLINESINAQQQQNNRNNLISIATERSIVISLFDNLLLRIELRFYPFQQDEQGIPNDGIIYLSQTLREMYLAEHTTKPKRNQQFVTLPQTTLPESLDFRGPQGIPAEEIASRMQARDPLIRKFVEYSGHYVIVTRVVDFLEAYMEQFTDPQLQWKWIRATRKFTLIWLGLSNRGYENFGKFSTQIHINQSSVTLIGKDMQQQIACRRDMTILREALLLFTANSLMNTLNHLSRAYSWQILHANINAYDVDGNPAPTYYACNQSATKKLFVQFHTDGQPPAIYMKDECPQQPESSENSSNINANNKTRIGKAIDIDGFRKLNYDRIPGTTFMRKSDYLLTTFIN